MSVSHLAVTDDGRNVVVNEHALVADDSRAMRGVVVRSEELKRDRYCDRRGSPNLGCDRNDGTGRPGEGNLQLHRCRPAVMVTEPRSAPFGAKMGPVKFTTAPPSGAGPVKTMVIGAGCRARTLAGTMTDATATGGGRMRRW